MNGANVRGWAVLYRFRVHPLRETEFVDLWNEARRGLQRRHGTGGSRPHPAEDGTWCAWAVWPSEAEWEADAADAGLPLLGAEARCACVLECAAPLATGAVRELLAAE